MDWSFIKPKEVYLPYEKNPETISKDYGFSFRGINLTANVGFNRIILNPGFNIGLRYNYGSSVFQIPLLLTLSPSLYVRIYGGGILTFGNPKVPHTNVKLEESVYRLMFGLSFATPPLNFSKVGVQIVQDISYTDFSKGESFSLSYPKNIYTGFTFNTGVRVKLHL